MKQIQGRSDARARPEGCAVRVYGDVPDCVLEHTCAQMRERWCVAVCSYWIPRRREQTNNHSFAGINNTVWLLSTMEDAKVKSSISISLGPSCTVLSMLSTSILDHCRSH